MVGDRPIVVRSKGAFAPPRGAAISLRWDAAPCIYSIPRTDAVSPPATQCPTRFPWKSNQGGFGHEQICPPRRRAAALAASLFASPAFAATEITFYYPIAVGGPITKTVDSYAAAFQKQHPDIMVKPVYTEAIRTRSSKR